MKKLLLLLILSGLFISSNVAMAQQVVTTTNTSNPNACDGVAIFNDSNSVVQNAISWYGNGVVIQNGGYSVTGLCAGTYVVTYTTGSGTISYTFIIGNGNSNPCTGYNLTTSTVNSTDSLSCDGSMVVVATGGTAPYVYNWSNGSTTQSINNLCPAVYYCTVVDANGCTSTITGIVIDESSDTMVVINNNTFIDSTLLGNLGNQWIVDCVTDFLAIDSAFISSYGYMSIDSIIVTWTLIDTNALVVLQFPVSYYVGNAANGVYSAAFTLFCMQKSMETGYLQANDRIYLNSALMGIEVKEEINFSITNPFENSIHLQFEENSDFNVEICDIKGSKIYSTNAVNVSNLDIETSSFERGTYFIRIIQGNSIQTRKLIK